MGRWWQLDPLADHEALVSFTPYNYSFNNPILYNDPEGDCPMCLPILWAIAEAIGTVTTAEVVTGTAVAAGGATAITFGDQIIRAMSGGGNAEVLLNPASGFREARQASEGKKQPDQEAAQRGRDNEKKALKDEGLEKNNKTETVIDPKTGKERNVKPDGENETTVGEVKDTKRVSNTGQIRGEREVAKQKGKDFKIITGDKTKVSKTIPEKEIVRKPYLGPQE